jgi:NAD(P)-dependent dehydrogenase (short-subunit alcohol dehydrogenase family)
MNISSSVALVTGAGSGLGEACARHFAALGAKVAVIDLNLEAAQAVATSIGANAIALRADVSSEADVQAAIDATLSAFGAVHIAISCAGITTGVKTAGKKGPHPLDTFARVVQVNLVGTFNVVRLAAQVMLANEPNAAGERGVLVNTASVAAFDGQLGQVAYAASKGGVAAMTLPIARDLSRDGIRVCTIAPGLFDTAMMASFTDEVRASLGAQVPFPSRLGKPEEYAALAQHIVENAMLNGETIRLDGALRMGVK